MVSATFSVTGLLWEGAIGLPEVAWVGLWLEQPRSSAETIKSQNLWLESSKSSSYVLMFRKYAIWNDELDELFNLSGHRFWLFMVSALDLGCSNHNPTQATTGNLIATLCQYHFGQKVGYFQKLYNISTFSVTGLLWEVAIGLPEVAWVGLWLEQPRSSAETIRSQNLWLESSESPFLPSNWPLTE